MKIEHYKVMAAIKALYDIGDKELPASVSFNLFKIRRKLMPVYEFQAEEENKLVAKYGVDDGNGKKQIKSVEGKMALEKFINEINSQMEEIDYEPVDMKLPDINMSIDQFEVLSNFINFTE